VSAKAEAAAGGAKVRHVFAAFLLEDYSGRARVYAVVGGKPYDVKEVEVEAGEPVQVRLQVPADATTIRVVVTDEEDYILLDKTVTVPAEPGAPAWLKLTPGLEEWFGVGAEQPGETLTQPVPPELAQLLQQLEQQVHQLEQQAQQLEQQAQ